MKAVITEIVIKVQANHPDVPEHFSRYLLKDQTHLYHIQGEKELKKLKVCSAKIINKETKIPLFKPKNKGRRGDPLKPKKPNKSHAGFFGSGGYGT